MPRRLWGPSNRMREKAASGVLASLRRSPCGHETRACLGRLGVGGYEYRFASLLTAALLDGLFAQPSGYCNTDTAHELTVAYCATIEFFGSLLGRGLHHCRRFLPDQDFAHLHSDIRTQNVIQQVQEGRAAIMAIDLVVLDPEGEREGHEHEEVR